jgi:hypothetical protein
VPFFYLILRALGSGAGASWLGSCVLCTDLLWLAAGREIGVWGVLQFLRCFAVLQIVLFDHYQSLTALICEGILLGMLLATTTAGQRSSLSPSPNSSASQAGPDGSPFCVHVAILPFDAPSQFAPPSVRAALVNMSSIDWTTRANGPSLVRRAIETMLADADAAPTKQEFAWWACLIARAPCTLLYTEEHRRIAYVGNPVVWIPVLLSVVTSIIDVAVTRNIGRLDVALVLGYLAAIVVRGEPPAYCAGMVFEMALLVRCLEQVPVSVRAFVMWMAAGGCMSSYFLSNPLAYGLYVADFGFIGWNCARLSILCFGNSERRACSR